MVLTVEEVPNFLTAFISTGKFKPVSIDFATPDISGYNREYYFSLCHFDDNELFVEPTYRDDKFMAADPESIILISKSVKTDTYFKYKKCCNNVILFDIED